jgi:dienelactone hydrolase
MKAEDAAEFGAALDPWIAKHGEAAVWPIVKKFTETLRSDPAHKKIGAVGSCSGARFAIFLAHEGADPYADAVVGCHPSFMTLPIELEKIAKPVDIEVGDADVIFKASDIEMAREIFKTKPGCQVQVYPDQVHGFTIRGDLSVEKDRKAKEKACESVCTSLSFLLMFLDDKILSKTPLLILVR